MRREFKWVWFASRSSSQKQNFPTCFSKNSGTMLKRRICRRIGILDICNFFILQDYLFRTVCYIVIIIYLEICIRIIPKSVRTLRILGTNKFRIFILCINPNKIYLPGVFRQNDFQSILCALKYFFLGKSHEWLGCPGCRFRLGIRWFFPSTVKNIPIPLWNSRW